MEELSFVMDEVVKALREAQTEATHRRHSSSAFLAEISALAQELDRKVQALSTAIAQEPEIDPVCPIGECRRIASGTAIPNKIISIEDAADTGAEQ